MIPLIQDLTPDVQGRRKCILFVCSGNACRSQIAEGWARALFGRLVEAGSAGVETHGLDPHAVTVMAERGVDLSGQRSKLIDARSLARADLIVTLSDRAAAHLRTLGVSRPLVHIPCPSPGRRIRIGEVSLEHYRAMRDELRDAVTSLVVGQPDQHANALAG